MRSTVALKARKKGRKKNDLIGAKFEDKNMYFLDAEYYYSCDRIKNILPLATFWIISKCDLFDLIKKESCGKK